MNKPELVFCDGKKLNEAMFFDRNSGLLYFVAIRYNTIYSLNPQTNEIITYTTEGPVGGAVTDKNGDIIEAEKSGIYKINPTTKEKTLIKQILPCETMRYNHLILDSKGRILIDVVGDELRHAGEGGLYIIDGDKVRCLVANTTVANGVVLNRTETKLYFTDTPSRLVKEYDYDIETGTVSNEKTVLDMTDCVGLPDGVMLDKTEKYLYIAEWNSGLLSKWEIATGKKVSETEFPSAHVTSSFIAGDYIYVTTAKREDTDPEPSGGIFRLRLEV